MLKHVKLVWISFQSFLDGAPEFSFSLRKMKVEILFLFLVLISEASFIEEDDITTINPIEDFSLFEDPLPKNQSETFCGDFQSL